MENPSDLIDTVLLPGMQTLRVAKALDRVASLTHEMRESEALCARVRDRLRFLRSALPHARDRVDPDEFSRLVPRFAETIGLVIQLLKKYSEKKVLQRVAASRAVREGVRRLHDKIDAVFVDAGLANVPEMAAWKDLEPADVNAQHALLEDLVESRSALVNGLSEAQVEEALTEIQLEIERRPNPSAFKALLQRARDAAAKQLGADAPTIESIPIWFVSRDDIEIGEQIDVGAFGAVHRAKWGVARTEVCAKLLFTEGADAQRRLLDETRVWHQLSHPNVVRMLGACHVGTPLFFISELARNKNLADFLDKPEHKCQLWQLFCDAAQGLSYLHGKCIVHADIKCNNILVGNDGKAQLCDFGFAHTRTLSVGKSVKVQTEAVRWKAPECLLEIGAAANPTFASDVYSLGMSIIEAKIGGVPWGVVADDVVIEEVASHEGYPRPDGVFSDEEWKLVQGMTAFEAANRMSLPQVIEALQELADGEARERCEAPAPKPVDLECESCGSANRSKSKFCNECGKPLNEIGLETQ